MDAKIVALPAEKIGAWDSFHAVFPEVFGFPDFYGCNMDAWIDCMTYLNDPDALMSRVAVAKGGVVVIKVDEAAAFATRCPEQYGALLERIPLTFEHSLHGERSSCILLR